jgi:hypothetical protein
VTLLPAGGMTMSVSDGAAAREASIESRWYLPRLSLRLSRSVFSPRTARARAKPPAELPPEADAEAEPVAEAGVGDGPSVTADSMLELVMLDVSTAESCGGGDGPLLFSDSIQSAGVGGTGPRAVTPLGGGRRVGGEATGSVLNGLGILGRFWGGGPGGGGGSGTLLSHRT